MLLRLRRTNEPASSLAYQRVICRRKISRAITTVTAIIKLLIAYMYSCFRFTTVTCVLHTSIPRTRRYSMLSHFVRLELSKKSKTSHFALRYRCGMHGTARRDAVVTPVWFRLLVCVIFFFSLSSYSSSPRISTQQHSGGFSRIRRCKQLV